MLLKRTAFFAACLMLFLVAALVGTKTQSAAEKKLKDIPSRNFKRACDVSKENGVASCHIQVVTDGNGKPQASPNVVSGFGTVQFHSAYNLPCTPGGPVASTCSTPITFGPQIIAIVDAYNDPTVENDLSVYSSTYGLPACTKANGCLTVVNQSGGSILPQNNSSWALETSLDVQTAHMICQTCKILLVEASTNSLLDLAVSVNQAAAMGATSISNSYGASEWSGETGYDSYYNHPNVAVTASSGDGGYGAEFPAASKNVIAVGGTTLSLFTDNSYSGESVWNGTGSGCSAYELANSYQTALSNWNLTNCGTKRAIADIAADADPNTGAAIYDSTPYNGSAGWWIVGGTSLASPIVASEYALAAVTNSNPASVLYSNYNLTNFHDVTSGSNGNCGGTIMCNGAAGFDGPTGLGTLNGLVGFGASITTPTPTATPTPTLTPSPTDTPTITPSPTGTPSPTATPTPTNGPDTQAPTVSITSPLNGGVVKQFLKTSISAAANDNVGVTKVDFYVNGTRISTDFTSPYSTNWTVPFGRNRLYNLTAKAYDAANNVGTSTTVTVTSQ